MSIPADRQAFKDYCLRALGAPVLQINVDDTQVEDRVDEAIYLYQQFHMDAVVKTYLPLVAGPSNFLLNSFTIVGTFQEGETLEVTTSTLGTSVGARAQVLKLTGNAIWTINLGKGVVPITGEASTYMSVGDAVVGKTSNATATVQSLTAAGAYDLGYFNVAEPVMAVTRVIGPFENHLSSGDILFDPQVQFNMSLQTNFVNTSLISYYMGRSYQTLLTDLIYGKTAIRYQRHQNRLYLDTNFKTFIAPLQFVVAECYTAIDPTTFTNVWSDEWLQRYAIALIKRQWAQNLSKYQGIALPGGVTLDGKGMMQEAVLDIKDLREELKSTYQLPIDFFIG